MNINEPIIHLAVTACAPDPGDQKRQKALSSYLNWLARKESDLKEAKAPFIPLKPRVTRENLWNL